MSKEFNLEDINQLKDAAAKALKDKEGGGNQEIGTLLKEIKVGDRVRCFVFFGEKDLVGEKANYFEGKVLTKNLDEEEIRVRIEKEVRDGKEVTDSIGNDVPVAASPDAVEKLKNSGSNNS